jgi:hypothetical protein
MEEIIGASVYKSDNMAMGIRFADHKLAPTSPTSGGRLVGIVRLRTKATGSDPK